MKISIKTQSFTFAGKEYIAMEKQDFTRLMRITKDDEGFPSSFVDKLFSGENRLKIWREYRGLTMQELADKAEISQSYLLELKNNKREDALKIWKKLGEILKADLELLV